MQLVYNMFISNNYASLHLWWKENLVKHQNVSKYYENDCRSLVLVGREKYDFIYIKIRCLIGVKGGIAFVNFQSYAKIKVDSNDSLPLEKTMAFYNVLILIRWVFNKNKSNYYYSIFLGKAFYELPKK